MIIKHLFHEIAEQKIYVFMKGSGNPKENHEIIGLSIENKNEMLKAMGTIEDYPDITD